MKYNCFATRNQFTKTKINSTEGDKHEFSIFTDETGCGPGKAAPLQGTGLK